MSPKASTAGLDSRVMSREKMGNNLQETLLKESSSMERILAALGMFAAVVILA